MMIKDASIEIIQKCVNHCIHCSSCSTEECTVMLQFDIVKRAITDLQKLKTERICLSGGEPFLHPDIFKIVKEISDRNMIADIYSCGIIKTEKKSESLSIDILSKIKASGVHSLIFNVPSTHEGSYDYITQSKGHFPLLCESITNAIKCGIRAEIHFVPMRHNINDAVDIVEFAEKMGVEQVNFLKLVPHGRARDNIQDLALEDNEIDTLCSRLTALKIDGKAIRLGLPLSLDGDAPPCHAVREKLYIKFDGSVFGCEAFKYIMFYDKQGNPIMPESIFEKSVLEIYQHSEHLSRSLSLVECYENCHMSCENCPVQKFLKEQGIVK